MGACCSLVQRKLAGPANSHARTILEAAFTEAGEAEVEPGAKKIIFGRVDHQVPGSAGSAHVAPTCAPS